MTRAYMMFSIIIITFLQTTSYTYSQEKTLVQIKSEAFKILNRSRPPYYIDSLQKFKPDNKNTVPNYKKYEIVAKDNAKKALDELRKGNTKGAQALIEVARENSVHADDILNILELERDLHTKAKIDNFHERLPDILRPTVEYIEGMKEALVLYMPTIRSAELERYQKEKNGEEANYGAILIKKAGPKLPFISEILLIANTLEATSLHPQKRIKEFLDYLEALNLREYFRAYKEAKSIVDNASSHLNGPNREFFAIDSINQANATMLRPEHIQLVSRNENRQQKVGSLERLDASRLVERTARDQITNVLTPISLSTTRAIIASLLNFSVSTTALPVWQSTGLNILAGNLLEVTATGLVGWDSSASTVGPDGQGGVGAGDTIHLVTTQGLPTQSLVGQIGAASTLDGSGFFIGSDFSSDVTSSGTLFLGFNDGFIKPDRSGVTGGRNRGQQR